MTKHARDPNRRKYVLCGLPVTKVHSVKNSPDVTCNNCKRMLGLSERTTRAHGPVPENIWPGYPLRCEWVIRSGTGLALCGKIPCREHKSQLRD